MILGKSLYFPWIDITYKILHSRQKILSYKILSTMMCNMLIILIIMAVHCFGQWDDNLSQETNFYSNSFIRNETYNKKIRLAKSRTLYYANTVMTLRLILSDDIPGNKQKSLTYSTCNKTVNSNSRKNYCSVSRSITNLKCITSNKIFLSTPMQGWICSFCIQGVLPFYK